ncbi:hypothetical protein C8F04DRAFT_1264069 [Mycena alexandri]|uniref:Uncharacterized protein n=1 Tax=Mycena alexandri TaxID=1745969 RepID=A0AAD6SM01_9AGAR|nr:hypothetical protein C8F04DRAFT_1264069 [Mycena alexandri]
MAPAAGMKETAKKTPLAPGQAARQRRTRKKGNGLKPGKMSWIFGTKLVFFSARAQEWKDASENGNLALGLFYTKITNLYILKYGYDLEDDEDVAEDTADPTDPDAVIPGSENLTQEEADRRSGINATIRRRVAAWYCRTYRGLEAREKNVFADMLAGVEATGPTYPKRAQPIHFYSRKYYEERVKARFEARWAVEVKRAEDLELEEPEPIKVRNAVTKEVYEGESQEFRDELKLAVEAEPLAAVRAWELTRSESESKTPQEINAALKNAAFYLEPLANAIRDKFLLNCTILVCGPMGDRGGAIEVRSVHAGTTKGLAPRKWYQTDPAGYDATEKSFVKFTKKCFSEEDCLARTVGVEQVDGTTPSGPSGVHSQISLSGGGSAAGNAGASSQTAPPSPDGDTASSSAAQGGRSQGAGGEGDAAGDAAAGGDAGGGNAGGGDAGGDAAAGGDAGGEAAAGGDAGGDAAGGDSAGGDSAGGDSAGGGVDDEMNGGDNTDDMNTHPAWLQRDGGNWSPEVGRAYKAFYAAKDEFGDAWADCVEVWVEMEKASGFNNEGGHLTTNERPAAVGDFLSRGRRWEKVREIEYVGSKKEEGTYVAKWWAWWNQILGEGGLPKMHGRTGFMLVLGALLWWGVKLVASGEIVMKTRVEAKGKGKQPAKRKRADVDEYEEEGSEEELGAQRLTRDKHRKEEEGVKRQTRGQGKAAAAKKVAPAAKKVAGRGRRS